MNIPKKKTITFYTHVGEPHEKQLFWAEMTTGVEILQYLEAYKKWHILAFGETEAQKLTKGKKFVIKKMDWF